MFPHGQDGDDGNKTYAQIDQALMAKTMMGFASAVLKMAFASRTRDYASNHGRVTVQKVLMAPDNIIMAKAEGGRRIA